MLEQWPGDYAKPCSMTLWRWLDEAVRHGLIAQTGTGRRSDPFRYWLPEKMVEWEANPLWKLERHSREDLAKLMRTLR